MATNAPLTCPYCEKSVDPDQCSFDKRMNLHCPCKEKIILMPGPNGVSKEVPTYSVFTSLTINGDTYNYVKSK